MKALFYWMLYIGYYLILRWPLFDVSWFTHFLSSSGIRIEIVVGLLCFCARLRWLSLLYIVCIAYCISPLLGQSFQEIRHFSWSWGGGCGGRPSAPPRFPPLKPAAQMLTNINKSVCVSLGFLPQNFEQFLPNFNIKTFSKFCIVFAPSLAWKFKRQ